MEFDMSYNLLSIFSTVLLIFVTFITVFQKLKLRWPVKVNCWFCNKNTKICRQQLNWWLCPYCEQYNGFSKDGDYAYNIPEQYKTTSNEIRNYCMVSQGTQSNKVPTNGLCKHCNVNESLKISKLSNYKATNERNYEVEIKQFKDSLEQRYPLCVNCKATVHNTLNKQALWLAEYKMLLFKQRSYHLIAKNAKYSEPIFRIISTILDSMVAYNMDFIFLPVGGLFFQFCACWVAPARKRSADMLLMLLWICIIILLPFKDSKLMKADLQNTWFSLEYVTQYHMIMLFASIIGFINVKPRSHKHASAKNMSFKKIESFTNDTVLSNSSIRNANDKNNINTKITNDLSETITSPLSPNIMNTSMPLSMEKSTISTPTIFQSSLINQELQLSSTPINDNNKLFHNLSPYKRGLTDSYGFNDSWSTLSTLSLSDDKPKYNAKSHKIFERKVYGTESSDLFKKMANISGKKRILSPPKLKSVTQASWVAGGYWQEDIDAPSLSRSSSQSSGFGSTGSNFAPSREPSIHEFDQCSVMSDVTQFCYTSRQNNISPVGSLCQQSSQFSFFEPKNSINNQTMKFVSPNVYTPQTLLLSQNYQKNNTQFMGQCLQGQNANISDIKNPSEMHMFPSHTTIVTSPVWLPALLCGSLVLNLIVLCINLLR